MKAFNMPSLQGTIEVPGDKSISHRAAILASINYGETEISNYLLSEDCIATLKCFQSMGVDIQIDKTNVLVNGMGSNSLKKPNEILDVGNSGTGIRLLTGLLAGQNFSSKITGDFSIRNRPMDRIIEPLSLMGAKIEATRDGKYCPLIISPSTLVGINYELKIMSAQIKSAILFGGLFSKGITRIYEKVKSRDHTENMMDYLEYNITTKNNEIILGQDHRMIAKNISVPGDISSASFFIVGALIKEGSKILIKNVGINETRMGCIEILKRMGGIIELRNQRKTSGEIVADIYVESSELNGVEIRGDIIPSLIDEIPVLSVAACFANGVTKISDAQELRVKESDRIKTIVSELSKMDANIMELDDGIIIKGKNQLKGSHLKSHNDHRIAMALSIASIAAEGESFISDTECINTSFPNFYSILSKLSTHLLT